MGVEAFPVNHGDTQWATRRFIRAGQPGATLLPTSGSRRCSLLSRLDVNRANSGWTSDVSFVDMVNSFLSRYVVGCCLWAAVWRCEQQTPAWRTCRNIRGGAWTALSLNNIRTVGYGARAVDGAPPHSGLTVVAAGVTTHGQAFQPHCHLWALLSGDLYTLRAFLKHASLSLTGAEYETILDRHALHTTSEAHRASWRARDILPNHTFTRIPA